MPARMYADSTRLIHFSMAFLSNGGRSGLRLDTDSPVRAVDNEVSASPSAMMLLLGCSRGDGERTRSVVGAKEKGGKIHQDKVVLGIPRNTYTYSLHSPVGKYKDATVMYCRLQKVGKVRTSVAPMWKCRLLGFVAEFDDDGGKWFR